LNKKTRTPIPFQDYQRISRVIKTVVDGVEGNTARACIFFAIVGASILEAVYKKSCLPLAGNAYYAVDPTAENVVAFANVDRDGNTVGSGAFHCWIQCEEHIIDFMAPIFQESVASAGLAMKVPRKMFQKPLRSMSVSVRDLQREGDYYVEHNVALTQSIFDDFLSKNHTQDLAQICLHWFQKPPKNMPKTFSMQDDLGERYDMTLASLDLVGAW